MVTWEARVTLCLLVTCVVELSGTRSGRGCSRRCGRCCSSRGRHRGCYTSGVQGVDKATGVRLQDWILEMWTRLYNKIFRTTGPRRPGHTGQLHLRVGKACELSFKVAIFL